MPSMRVMAPCEPARAPKRRRVTETVAREPSPSSDGACNWGALASELRAALGEWAPEDPIRLCGDAPLDVLLARPLQVMALAKERVNTWEYRQVPRCWLRLYEDASLSHVALLLRDIRNDQDRWIDEVVTVIDNAIIMTGACHRRELFDMILLKMQHVIKADVGSVWPEGIPIASPPVLLTGNHVSSSIHPTLTTFQVHMDKYTTPLLIHDAISHWPAMQSWCQPRYLLQQSLGGRRLVPVEIGETYTHSGWRQELMSLREYMEKFAMPESPHSIGYMGQHDLLSQIPALRADIAIPDYCFTSPPDIVPETLKGQSPVTELDEPQMNAWLGPKGTRSPLHHDPYHNIFCQVVGYKYVRLYPPTCVSTMYAHGVDENGISMANTSAVDMRFRPSDKSNIAVTSPEDVPMFSARKDFQEAILGPGDSLYIPAGWWHYFESLSTSFSVSFWWN